MTTVRFSYDKRVFRMITNGHAGYGPRGSDIVCAAASMLSQTLIASVLESGDVADLRGATCTEGAAALDVVATADGAERMRTRFDMARRGFELLSEKYPENVRCEGRNPMRP